MRRLYYWVLSWAHSRYGTPALFVISFTESSFFPIPPDVLQIALSVSKPRRSFYYALVSTIASVLGSILGWMIGYAIWELTSEFFFSYIPGFSAEKFEQVAELYQANAMLAILAAAFTPIPYKIFTVAAGACHVPLGVLVIASILGRGGRFFLVATAIYFFGEPAKRFLERYFELVTIAGFLLLVGGFMAMKYVL